MVTTIRKHLQLHHGDEYEKSIKDFGLHRPKSSTVEGKHVEFEPFTRSGFYTRLIAWWTVTSQVRLHCFSLSP
jgi:hypothetical protein